VKTIELIHGDCLNDLPQIESNSVDVILTDPPYKYLKKQKLEVDFNEHLFFAEAKRVLKKSGFIILFGRGTSFYRWNTILADLGFEFKEEIVWNKSYNSSPVTPINRIHETISIHSISGCINLSFIPYTEIKTDLKSIQQDVKRIKSALGNKGELDDLVRFLETGEVDYKPENRTLGSNTTVQTAMSQQSRGVKTMQAITRGMKEKSILDINRDHFNNIHPTQKPVRVIERLLALTSKEGDLVLDPFAGSFSTAEACHNLELNFKGWEIDKEYFKKGKRRIEEIPKTLFTKTYL
jgi:site-specific DNA-methyltransferase (adenine-specific)